MKRLFALVFALLVGLVLLNVPAFAAGPTAVSDEVTPVPVRDSLVVKCPQVADAGEKVLVKVYTRLTGQPAPKSEVWAVRWGPNVSPVPAADAASLDPAAEVAALDFAPRFLGYTDANGEVVAVFRGGQYLIVAVKEEFAPGFARLTIVQELKALVLRAPALAKVMEPVPIQVVEKSVLTVEIPVAGAGVWALNVKSLPLTTANAPDYAAAALRVGIFLGKTNEKGFVDPTPIFKLAGDYYLVAVRDGYQPGLGKISVKGLISATPTITAKPLPPISVNPTLSPSAIALNKRITLKPAAVEPVAIDETVLGKGTIQALP